MVEYITKSDAVFAACKVLDAFGGCHMGPFCPDSGCKEVREVFKNVPAADVVEVRHASWIEDGYYGEPCVCSYCGEPCKDTVMGKPRWNYCPVCGAVMDGGQGDV